MTIKELIDKVQEEKPNTFTDEKLLSYINEIEHDVAEQTHEEFVPYTAVNDTELQVHPPYDRFYVSYVKAMIDYANGEYDRYQNAMQLFNAHFGEFMAWFADTYRPADDWRRQG